MVGRGRGSNQPAVAQRTNRSGAGIGATAKRHVSGECGGRLATPSSCSRRSQSWPQRAAGRPMTAARRAVRRAGTRRRRLAARVGGSERGSGPAACRGGRRSEGCRRGRWARSGRAHACRPGVRAGGRSHTARVGVAARGSARHAGAVVAGRPTKAGPPRRCAEGTMGARVPHACRLCGSGGRNGRAGAGPARVWPRGRRSERSAGRGSASRRLFHVKRVNVQGPCLSEWSATDQVTVVVPVGSRP